MSQTITVGNDNALKDAYRALSEGEGGTILLQGNEAPYSVLLGKAGSSQVTITSANADDKALVEQINLGGVENVTIDDVVVDDGGVGDAEDLQIGGSQGVTVRNVLFRGQAEDRLVTAENKDDVQNGGKLGAIAGSQDVTFENNTITSYYSGLGVLRSSDVEVSGNEFTKIQADSMFMAAVQDTDITDNHFHDFLGWPGNHDDMIQVWGTNHETLTRDLTISGNIFDSGGGAAFQTILIQNEERDGAYENIEITDNLIRNGHAHGVYVADADGVLVANNTLLLNPDSKMEYATGDSATSMPEIALVRVENAMARDNITGGFWKIEGEVERSGNKIVDYNDPDSEDHVGRHFVNAEEGGALSLDDLKLVADSPWNGSGADVTQAGRESPAPEEAAGSETPQEDVRPDPEPESDSDLQEPSDAEGEAPQPEAPRDEAEAGGEAGPVEEERPEEPEAAAPALALDVDDIVLRPYNLQKLSETLSRDGAADATRFEVRDTAGGDNFWLMQGGGRIDASEGVELDGSDLDQLWIQGEGGASTQTLEIRAGDGEAFGAWDQFDLVTLGWGEALG